MLNRLILSGFLALSSLSLQTNADSFQFSGLKPYDLKWDGNASELKVTMPFCVKLDSAPIPTKVKQADIKYQLKFNDLNNDGSGHFIAVDGQKKLPLELTLNASGSKILTPGQDSDVLDNSSLCQASTSTLSLTAKVAGALNEIEAGTYKARINAKAFNRGFDSDTDALMELSITIPKLIKITAPSQITLDGFPNLQKTEDLCVYRNGFGFYNLKVAALDVDGGRFELKRVGKLQTTLPYQVSIRSKNIDKMLSPNDLIRDLKGNLSPTCQNGDKLQFKLSIPDATAKKSYAGVYQGQLKITVEAQ